jgi:hypothetical protein
MKLKGRLNLGNACFYYLQRSLPCHLLSKSINIKTYKSIILPVVLCGCENWSLTLREEYRLWVLRSIFGTKGKKGAGCWWRPHNEELHNLYTPNNILVIKSRKMGWAGHVTRMGEMRNTYNILVGQGRGR